MTTVDRQKWIADRIRFLEGELDKGARDEERSAIESEIENLRKEAGISGRWFRWVLGFPRRPTGR